MLLLQNYLLNVLDIFDDLTHFGVIRYDYDGITNCAKPSKPGFCKNKQFYVVLLYNNTRDM